MRVFIVDDHTLVRDGIKWMLVNEPSIEVVGEASNGAELLVALDDAVCDVLLLDIRMPTLSGLEVLAALKVRGAGPPVLVLSMYDDASLVREAITLGAAGYLNKGAGRDELISAIHTVGSGGSYLQGELAAPLVRSIGENVQPSQGWVSAEERQLLLLVAEGLGNREIAARVGRSEAAVRAVLTAMFKRLDVHTRAEAVAAATRLGALD